MSSELPVMLFDGECNLCNATVSFVMRNERAPLVRFAALQSEAAKTLLDARVGRERSAELRGLEDDVATSPGTIVLVDGDGAHVCSSAALRLAKHLTWPWRLVRIGVLVPRFLRDWIYRFIAKRRYAWFGKSDSCRIPTPEERARFLS